MPARRSRPDTARRDRGVRSAPRPRAGSLERRPGEGPRVRARSRTSDPPPPRRGRPRASPPVPRGWRAGCGAWLPIVRARRRARLREPSADRRAHLVERTQADEQHASGVDHPNHLGERRPPIGDQMENPPKVRAVEGPIAERHPGGIAQDEGEDRFSAGLLDELAEHRRGEVETREREACLVKPQGEQPRTDADLQDAATRLELGGQQRDRAGHRLVGDRPRPVIVVGRAVEPDGLAHDVGGYDFGMSLVGSTNGRFATVTGTRPRGVSASNADPSVSRRIGTHA